MQHTQSLLTFFFLEGLIFREFLRFYQPGALGSSKGGVQVPEQWSTWIQIKTMPFLWMQWGRQCSELNSNLGHDRWMVSFCHGCSTWAKEGGPRYHSEQRDSDAVLCRFFVLFPFGFSFPSSSWAICFPSSPWPFHSSRLASRGIVLALQRALGDRGYQPLSLLIYYLRISKRTRSIT